MPFGISGPAGQFVEQCIGELIRSQGVVQFEETLEVFETAINKIKPYVEVRSRRIGGATFQIPAEVRTDRKVSLSIKWMIKYSRDRNGRNMADKLAGEIVAAAKGEGAAFKKKEDTHRMAEANKAFSHFKV